MTESTSFSRFRSQSWRSPLRIKSIIYRIKGQVKNPEKKMIYKWFAEEEEMCFEPSTVEWQRRRLNSKTSLLLLSVSFCSSPLVFLPLHSAGFSLLRLRPRKKFFTRLYVDSRTTRVLCEAPSCNSELAVCVAARYIREGRVDSTNSYLHSDAGACVGRLCARASTCQKRKWDGTKTSTGVSGSRWVGSGVSFYTN